MPAFSANIVALTLESEPRKCFAFISIFLYIISNKIYIQHLFVQITSCLRMIYAIARLNI